MFGFCPLFTPTLLWRRAGSDVDATTAAHRTQKPRRCHVSTGQNKKMQRRGRGCDNDDDDDEEQDDEAHPW